ncbi:MAG TPA: HutD family protein, partial [Gemmatimonadaceae bacterium]
KADEYRRMPWRNGLGETAQLAIGPAGATLDDFEWRVSMARIDADGPFSIFPDTDRTLTVLRGDGLYLSVDGRASVELTRDSEPLAFRGDIAAIAKLLGAPVADLNVMTRHGKLQHSMRRIPLPGDVTLAVNASVALLVCAEGPLVVTANARSARLESLDTLLLEQPPTELRVSGNEFAVAYLIEIEQCQRAAK